MASPTYMTNRRKYSKPQMVVWTDAYTLDAGLYIPSGVEYTDFIILSDHNRSEISIDVERIENRKRMINGRMRSYHVADKRKFSWDWEMLPSRAYDQSPQFDSQGLPTQSFTDYTVDVGAGGIAIADWYTNHPGSFYMLLSYDKVEQYDASNGYVAAVEVFFSSFGKSVVKRGTTDFWDISVELEEA